MHKFTRLTAVAICAVIFVLPVMVWADEDITASFTDENFLAAVYSVINGKEAPDPIFAGDVSDILSLEIPDKNIENLAGIEHFTELVVLNVSNNQLITLNLSANTELTNLNASNNLLTTLNVSANTALRNLNVSNNRLRSTSATALNLSNNTALTTLNVSDNQLASLDVTTNTALTTLNVSQNYIANQNLVTGFPGTPTFDPQRPRPTIITDSPLPPATFGEPYSQTIELSSDAVTFIWVLQSFVPVPGLTLSESGVLSGTPTDTGTFIFGIDVRNPIGINFKDFTLVINPKPLTADMLFSDTIVTYNGTSWLPVLANCTNTPPLVRDTDYTLDIPSSTPQLTNAGTYPVTITGKGNYTGELSFNLVINPKPLTADMLSIPAVTFNGNAQTPNLTITDSDRVVDLIKDTDYEVNNLPSRTEVGTSSVMVTGIGNYSGTASVNFVVNPKPLTAAMLSIPAVEFDSTAQTPVLTVTDPVLGELTINVDYQVTLTPQTAAGTYPITVTGIGNFTGTPSVNFVINPKEVSVLSSNRVIPGTDLNNQLTSTASTAVISAEFTAGPNPVAKSAGSVAFFYQGKQIQNASFTVFDAFGNVVNRVAVSDAVDHPGVARHPSGGGEFGRRIVGSWDLTDRKGRQVSEGTYLVKGTVTVDGKRERVSLLIGVR